jgi:hypothetical protein
MVKIFNQIVILALTLSALHASAEANLTKEFWISLRTDTENLGTSDEPFDGSTQAKFDAAMNSIPEGATVHIRPGTYQTEGQINWQLRSGVKMLGSGMDNTILQLVPGTPSPGSGTWVVASLGGVTNVEVSDLTCDCNYTYGDVTYCGVGLDGTDNAVRRVRVMNEAFSLSHNSECWGVVISNLQLPTSVSNIIEECEVGPLAYGTGISAVSLMAGANTEYISGIVRNNRIFLTTNSIGAQIAINGAWNADTLIEGNYVDGADSGFVRDTGGSTNIIFAHNVFKHVFQGFVFWNYKSQNLTFTDNKVLLSSAGSYFSAGFGFPDGSYQTNIVIKGNDVGFDGIPIRNDVYFLCASNVVGLTVTNNRVDFRMKNRVSASDTEMYDNHDQYGNYLTRLNIPNVGIADATSPGPNFINCLHASSVLAHLGRPGHPAAVVTNNKSRVTLNRTFSGDGSGFSQRECASVKRVVLWDHDLSGYKPEFLTD